MELELNLFYKARLDKLMEEHHLLPEEAIVFLIDYYYIDNANYFSILSRNLLFRLKQGVDRSFIIRLRTLYTVIGHFLKKLRYI